VAQRRESLMARWRRIYPSTRISARIESEIAIEIEIEIEITLPARIGPPLLARAVSSA